MEHDIFYMRQALHQAQQAFEKNEVPIGAIVVNASGEIIGSGHNLVEHEQQQTAHAEITAINQACKKINNWRLDLCWIYVSLEPCAMCFNLIVLSRIERLVYGASSPIFGYTLDNTSSLQVYRRNILEVASGVCAEESSDLLKIFFQKKRNLL